MQKNGGADCRNRVRKGCEQSCFLSLFTQYHRFNQSFLKGSFGGEENGVGHARIRRACLRARENSRLFSLCRLAGKRLLCGRMGDVGTLCLLSSAFAILGRLALGRFSMLDSGSVLCFVFLAASVLLLPSKQSVSCAVGNSILFQWLFFEVCRFPKDRVTSDGERGKDRRWLALLGAILLGVLASIVHPAWILVALGGILFFMLIQNVPELLFLIVIFWVPFFNFLPHPTVALTFAVLTGEIFWFGKLLCGHRDFRFSVLSFFVLLFSAFLFLGGVFGAGGAASFARASFMTILLLSYFPLCGLFLQPVWRKRAVLALCLSVLIVSFVGIGQYFFTDLELKWVDASRFGDIGGRVTSTFSNPNVLAEYLLLTFPIMMGEGIRTAYTHRVRLLFWFTAVVELCCLILTWSRGAWLGAIAAIGIFCLLYSSKSRRLLFWSLIPVVIWAPMLPHSVVNRFSSIGMLAESSIRYRLYTWQGTVRMLMAHPFGIGVGEEAFFAVYRSFAVSGTETVVHTHNLLIQIMTELGIIGLFCFGAVLFFLVQAVFSSYRKVGLRRISPRILGGFCALSGVIVMGFFDYVWYHGGIFWLFWMVMAQTAALSEDRIRETEDERRLFA